MAQNFATSFSKGLRASIEGDREQRRHGAALDLKRQEAAAARRDKLREQNLKIIGEVGTALSEIRANQGPEAAQKHLEMLAPVLTNLSFGSGIPVDQLGQRLKLAAETGATGAELGTQEAAKTTAQIPAEAAKATAVTTATQAAQEPFDIAKEERAAARPQSPLGKLQHDRDSAARLYGEDSPQARAFDDAIEGGGEPAKLTDIRGVRTEYTKLSGDFIATQDAYARVLSSPDTAGGDVGLVFNFMKMLDPASVVREGEFATAAAAAGLPDRIVQLARRIDTGERLTSDQRKDFRNVAGRMFETQLQKQRLLENTFRQLSGKLGMDPAKVVIPFVREKFSGFAPEPAGAAAATEAKPDLPSLGTAEEVEKLPSGSEFIWSPTGQTLRKD